MVYVAVGAGVGVVALVVIVLVVWLASGPRWLRRRCGDRPDVED